MGLTELEARVVAAVDVEALVSTTRALVRIPSWGGRETPAQELMARAMGDAGLEVDAWSIDLEVLAEHPHYSAEIEREEALGVVATLPGATADGSGGDARSLLLNGHVDVVPPGEASLWRHPPFEGVVEDGCLYGRGALDMKGGLCAGLFALRALRDEGVALLGDVHLESVVGEEDGGLGTLAASLRGYRADGAVVMEPTGGVVVPALPGVLNFRVSVRGASAHGAVRMEGVSAIEKFVPIYEALAMLESERNASATDPLFASYELPFALCVGTIRGGDWASSVPDHLTFEGRMAVLPGEGEAAARRALEDAVARAAAADSWMRRHPPAVEWWGGRFLGVRTPTDHPIVEAVASAATDVRGGAPDVAGVTYGADLGLLANVAETPGVLYGPGDIRLAHRPDEHVEIDELTAVARTLAVTAMRFCGVVGDEGRE